MHTNDSHLDWRYFYKLGDVGMSTCGFSAGALVKFLHPGVSKSRVEIGNQLDKVDLGGLAPLKMACIVEHSLLRSVVSSGC